MGKLTSSDLKFEIVTGAISWFKALTIRAMGVAVGLTIVVGLLAEAEGGDEEEFEGVRHSFDLLNEVLGEVGMAPHIEPLDLPPDQSFEAQMWGYGGLHAVRRLAAYHACERRLPPPSSYGDFATDPVTERLNDELLKHFNNGRSSLLMRLFSGGGERPKFEHLMWHSDCEGFYLPRDFDHVIFDSATSQREGLGGMIGSSVRLLEECKELAALILLPDDIDPEAEELWENAESPPADGPAWHVYGVEAFCLARLIRGCEASVASGAALVFT